MTYKALSTLPICAAIGTLALLASMPHMANAQEPPVRITRFVETDKELERLVNQYVSGENLTLGVVDGTPITSQGVRSELGPELDARVNRAVENYRAAFGFALTRSQAELLEVARAAQDMALSIILLREAQRANLTPPDALIDARIRQIKIDNGINVTNDTAWATFTMQQYNGRTPHEFHKLLADEWRRQNIWAIMAGDAGPIPGLKLPVFFPLDVSPADVREEYERIKNRWRKLIDVKYTRLGVSFPATLSVDLQQRVAAIVEQAGTRLKNGETYQNIRNFLELECAALPPMSVKPIAPTDVTAAGDAELDASEAGLLRDLDIGKVSDVKSSAEPDSDEGISRERLYVLKLTARTEDIQREFTDPVVQRQARGAVMQRKRAANRDKVRKALIRDAVILPKSLLK